MLHGSVCSVLSYMTATGSHTCTCTSAATSQSHGTSHPAAPGRRHLLSTPQRYPSLTTSQDTASLNERFAVSEKYATQTQKHTAGTSGSTTGSLNERFALKTEPQQTTLLHELRKLRKNYEKSQQSDSYPPAPSKLKTEPTQYHSSHQSTVQHRSILKKEDAVKTKVRDERVLLPPPMKKVKCSKSTNLTR